MGVVRGSIPRESIFLFLLLCFYFLKLCNNLLFFSVKWGPEEVSMAVQNALSSRVLYNHSNCPQFCFRFYIDVNACKYFFVCDSSAQLFRLLVGVCHI
jgi:hypothetical protein